MSSGNVVPAVGKGEGAKPRRILCLGVARFKNFIPLFRFSSMCSMFTVLLKPISGRPYIKAYPDVFLLKPLKKLKILIRFLNFCRTFFFFVEF